MDKEKSQLQEIAKLSDIIRKKYERIRYNKISVEDNVKKFFKPVVDPLEKFLDTSNDKIKKENVEIKQENHKIKQENDLLKSGLISNNLYNQDYNFHKNDNDETLMMSFKSTNDIDGRHDSDKESTTSDASLSKNLSQTASNESMNLETKRDELLEKVKIGDDEIDSEVGVRETQTGKFMFGNKQIMFKDDKFVISVSLINCTLSQMGY